MNFTELTKFLDSSLKNGIPGFDCAVYYKGMNVYRHMNGYSSAEKKTPVSGRERYNMYSCSKPITVTAAMQLYEKGYFSLDDKLCRYLPAFTEMWVKNDGKIKRAQNPIRIRDLFCMTAGFGYNPSSPSLRKAKAETGGRCPTLETMDYLAEEPLFFEPGTYWEYSFCHDVLAAVIEKISGMRFGEYVKKNIFEPLGMVHSTFLLPESELDTVAPQYEYKPVTGEYVNCGKEIWKFKLGTEYESGGAGCISTVDDFMKFLEELRTGNRLLKRETIDLMTTNSLSSEQLVNYWLPSYGYGLGVRCPKDGGGMTDFGWGGTAGSYLAVDIKNSMSLFYAQHVIGTHNNEARKSLTLIARDALYK